VSRFGSFSSTQTCRRYPSHKITEVRSRILGRVNLLAQGLDCFPGFLSRSAAYQSVSEQTLHVFLIVSIERLRVIIIDA
jgi:hypothetical protein